MVFSADHNRKNCKQPCGKSESAPTIHRTFFYMGIEAHRSDLLSCPVIWLLSAGMDELNFLAARLEKLDAAELTELNAALTSPQSDFHNIGQIIDYPENVDFYVHLPDVTSTGQLGRLLSKPFRHGGYAGGMESRDSPAPFWPAYCQHRAWCFLPIMAIW